MAYLLDTNTLIEAYKRYYGFDIIPGFWEWLITKNNKDMLFSIQEVKEEILCMEDSLTLWAKQRKGFFLEFTGIHAEHASTLMKWAKKSNRSFKEHAIDEFSKSADLYLIAHAMAGKHVVVSLEVPDPNTKKKIKIPDVCKKFNIECINTFTMLKRESARFEIAK